MSEDTPECSELQIKKKVFTGTYATQPLSNVFQDQETSNSPKNDTPMTCLNMKLRSCSRV